MSSSKKKQLRKEQNMTERQVSAAKDAKKLKIYTLSFWCVIALVACIFVGAVASNPIKNVVYKNTDAIVVGGHTLSSVEANYFYMDAINDYLNQNGDYIQYIIDVTKPLNKQIANDQTGETWADSFMESAKQNMISTYAVYNEAMKNNFKLSEEDVKQVDASLTMLQLYAAAYGYKDADAYLRAVYGNGSDTDSYRKYYEICTIANAYSVAHAESLKYDDAALRAYEDKIAYQYNAYTFATYYLNASSFLEGGTKGADDKITYSDAEKKAAAEAAKKIADELAAGNYENVEAFDAAIKNLEINSGADTVVTSVKYDNKLYSSISSLFRDWVVGKVENEGSEPTITDRKAGDITVVANKSGSGENEVINGYYVVRFTSKNDNTFPLKNVRHLLVSFQDGTTDATTGIVTYSDAQKAAAKFEAERLLAEFAKGDKTEEAFAELAKEHSTDPGSSANGGLYENVYPGQMVSAFEDWCYDISRQVGDTGIVETEYGYHVMYFVGNSEINYRDYMVENDLKSDDMLKWHEDLTKPVTVTVLNDKHIKTDLVLSAH